MTRDMRSLPFSRIRRFLRSAAVSVAGIPAGESAILTMSELIERCTLGLTGLQVHTVRSATTLNAKRLVCHCVPTAAAA